MPCSRTPKCRFLPSGFSLQKSPPPLTSVLLLGDRSADPPHRAGTIFTSSCMTRPDEFRVAAALEQSSASNNLSSRSAGTARLIILSHSFACSGNSFRYFANTACHASYSGLSAEARAANRSLTSSGM